MSQHQQGWMNMGGFDEYPQPVPYEDVAVLEAERQKLEKAVRVLQQSLHYFQKTCDSCRKHLRSIEERRQAHNNTNSTTATTDAVTDSQEIDASRKPQATSHLKREREEAGADSGSSAPPVEAATAAPSTSTSVPNDEEAGAAPRRRRFVQSAAFLESMRRLVAKNQERDITSGAAAAREERARLARAAQLAAMDREEQEITQQLSRAQNAVDELSAKVASAKPKLLRVAHVLTRMETEESQYIAAFYLSAIPVQEKEAEEGGGSDATVTMDAPVYFAPAVHTEETKALVRQQIVDALPPYLSFRAELDPVLAEVKTVMGEREQKRRAAPQHGMSNGTSFSASTSKLGTLPPHGVMSLDEAAAVLRFSGHHVTSAAPSSGVNAAAGSDAASGGDSEGTAASAGAADVPAADGAVPEVAWHLYEDAIAALDEFE